MNNKIVLVLPNKARARDGYEFDPCIYPWKIVGLSKIYYYCFDELSIYCNEKLIRSYQLVLLHYIEHYSLDYPGNIHNLFLSMCRKLNALGIEDISSISNTIIINYSGYLQIHKRWHLGNIRGFFKKWKMLGYPGVDEQAIELLNSMRIKGNNKGEAVLTRDPVKGPFTENELLAIHGELSNQYATGALSNREYALAWLFMAFGQRPVQYAMLKVKDFKTIAAQDGSVRFVISIPRAKQRGVLARQLLKERMLGNEAGNVVAMWIAQLKASAVEGVIKGVAVDELPIFPDWDQVSPVGLHHKLAITLGVELKNVIDRLQVISERTGEKIACCPTRFRYTIGTRAAEEGYGEMVIAELLDHANTSNVRVYTKATAKFAETINKAIAPVLAPIAMAFKGKIIHTEKDCEGGIRVGSGNPGNRDVGKCGHHGFCAAAVPHVCYTCIEFHPWLDGPHEEILAELITEREYIKAETDDNRIAGAKDRIIMAVTEVVNKCYELKTRGLE